MNRAELLMRANEQLSRAEANIISAPQASKDRIELAQALIKLAAELRKEPL